MKKLLLFSAILSVLAAGAIGASLNEKNSIAAGASDITPSSFRLWFSREGHAADGFTWKIWDGVEGHGAYLPNYVTHYGHTLNYYDLPSSISKIVFQVFDSGDNYKTALPEVNYTAGMNARIWYPTFSPSASIVTDSRPSVIVHTNHLADVFAGYFSCSSDKNNGYGEFDTLYRTWVFDSTSRLDGFITEEAALEALKGINKTGNDYGWSESAGVISYDYDNVGTKTEVTNAYDKIMQMRANYDSAQASARVSISNVGTKNDAVFVIGTIGAISFLAIGGWFIMRGIKRSSAD